MPMPRELAVRRTSPFARVSSATGTFSRSDPSRSSACRAVAAAWRTAVPPRVRPVLPPVPPLFGHRAVSPSTSVMRPIGIPSSSAAICAIAMRMPVPTSTLLV